MKVHIFLVSFVCNLLSFWFLLDNLNAKFLVNGTKLIDDIEVNGIL